MTAADSNATMPGLSGRGELLTGASCELEPASSGRSCPGCRKVLSLTVKVRETGPHCLGIGRVEVQCRFSGRSKACHSSNAASMQHGQDGQHGQHDPRQQHGQQDLLLLTV